MSIKKCVKLIKVLFISLIGSDQWCTTVQDSDLESNWAGYLEFFGLDIVSHATRSGPDYPIEVICSHAKKA